MAEKIYIEDFELAKQCARGDDNARKELYTKYAAYLFTLCIRYIGNREEARDLMHDAMMKIFDTIGKYKPSGALKSWCGRVTVNMVIDRMRKAKHFETTGIAQMLGIKEKTSSSLLFKAREQLAENVREYIKIHGL